MSEVLTLRPAFDMDPPRWSCVLRAEDGEALATFETPADAFGMLVVMGLHDSVAHHGEAGIEIEIASPAEFRKDLALLKEALGPYLCPVCGGLPTANLPAAARTLEHLKRRPSRPAS